MRKYIFHILILFFIILCSKKESPIVLPLNLSEADIKLDSRKQESGKTKKKRIPNLIKCDKVSPKVYSKFLNTAINIIFSFIDISSQGSEYTNKQLKIKSEINNILSKDTQKTILAVLPRILCSMWSKLKPKNFKKKFPSKFNINDYLKKIVESSQSNNKEEWTRFANKVFKIISKIIEIFFEILAKESSIDGTIQNDINIAKNKAKEALKNFEDELLNNSSEHVKKLFGTDKKCYFINLFKYIHNKIINIISQLDSTSSTCANLKKLVNIICHKDPNGEKLFKLWKVIYSETKLVTERLDESINNTNNEGVVHNLMIDYEDLMKIGCLALETKFLFKNGASNLKLMFDFFKCYINIIKNICVDLFKKDTVNILKEFNKIRC